MVFTTETSGQGQKLDNLGQKRTVGSDISVKSVW